MERSHAFETVLVLILIGLIGLLFLMIVSTPQQAKGWEMQGNGSVDYMFTGSDDTLYVFQENNVMAIKSDGDVAWNLHVPDEWRVSTVPESWGYAPIAGEAARHMYLYLSRPSSLKESAPIIPVDPWSTYKGYTISAEVMAISPDGTLSWEYPFTAGARSWTNGLDSGYRLADDVVIRQYENRVMVYHDNKEDVLDDGGKFLFDIGNISGPVAIDSRGRMYAVQAVKPDVRANAPVDYSNWTDMQRLMADPRLEGEDYQRIVYDPSYMIKTSVIDAFDSYGTRLWKQPMDGYVTHAVARNDTFYYSTDGGRIGGNTVNVAAGIALIAAAYVFLRFFILGTVARARTRIDSNRNRNDLLKFVSGNPGVTAVEISRGLKMNLGTVRYHLFILAANHKVVPYKDDGKFLRYFRNSGAYSPQERSWLSLMRREPIRKVIAALERNPGQSLQELARELDMSPTAVHNHISELSARGIVDRAQGDERGFAYTIREEYHPYVVKTMERL